MYKSTKIFGYFLWIKGDSIPLEYWVDVSLIIKGRDEEEKAQVTSACTVDKSVKIQGDLPQSEQTLRTIALRETREENKLLHSTEITVQWLVHWHSVLNYIVSQRAMKPSNNLSKYSMLKIHDNESDHISM